MRIKIKLDKRKKGLTSNGFPIIIYATKSGKDKKIRIGYYATVENWNAGLAIPKKKHPKYYELLDMVTEVKARISEILILSHRKGIHLEELKYLIFKTNQGVFFKAAVDLLANDVKNTKYSAVKSFNDYLPNAEYDEITYTKVAAYIKTLQAKGNKPAGIDSYIRSLRALWNKLTQLDNPFKGHAIEIPPKINTVATDTDLHVLINADLPYSGTVGGAGRYRDYWLLMFYLGGIDPEVLAKLQYDVHVIGNRIAFNRNKGRSKAACNVVVPEQALKILARYNCRPYLVPIYQANSYSDFMGNFLERFKRTCLRLRLSVQLRPKSARYTFINRAQNLLIDERITAQIVGHKRKTITSLYPNDFPLTMQDEAHLKIIDV